MTDTTGDALLNEAFERAVRTQATWYRPGASAPADRPTVPVERAAKALAKDLAKRVADAVEDRHARAQARVELYNVFLPVLLDISARHSRERTRLQMALWAVSVGAVVAVMIAIFL